MAGLRARRAPGVPRRGGRPAARRAGAAAAGRGRRRDRAGRGRAQPARARHHRGAARAPGPGGRAADADRRPALATALLRSRHRPGAGPDRRVGAPARRAGARCAGRPHGGLPPVGSAGRRAQRATMRCTPARGWRTRTPPPSATSTPSPPWPPAASPGRGDARRGRRGTAGAAQLLLARAIAPRSVGSRGDGPARRGSRSRCAARCWAACGGAAHDRRTRPSDRRARRRPRTTPSPQRVGSTRRCRACATRPACSRSSPAAAARSA